VCEKAKLNTLLEYILNIIRESSSKEEAYNRVLKLKVRAQYLSWEELERELFG